MNTISIWVYRAIFLSLIFLFFLRVPVHLAEGIMLGNDDTAILRHQRVVCAQPHPVPKVSRVRHNGVCSEYKLPRGLDKVRQTLIQTRSAS